MKTDIEQTASQKQSEQARASERLLLLTSDQLYMVFDCESVGLHGETFGVGWVVVNGHGDEITRVLVKCDPKEAVGSDSGRKWVQENIPAFNGPGVHSQPTPRDVRACFWVEWTIWKQQGAILVADCCWPVEARFLVQCVDDAHDEREWQGPYPLHDLASILLAAGKDPLQKFERKENELPEHNPLADARQSARILIETLKGMNQ